MKITKRFAAWTTALVLVGAAAGSTAIAKDGNHKDGPPREGRRFAPPVIVVLDVNSDGTIDATEIENASASLKKLDKNGDGSLTTQELRPHRGEGRGPKRGQCKSGPEDAPAPVE